MGLRYALNANANESDRVKERLEECLLYVSMEARRLERRYLYKSEMKANLFLQVIFVVLLPSSEPRAIPNLVQSHIRLLKAQEGLEIVV